MIQTGFQAPISVFRHRLLQLFQLSIFCKLPIQPMKTLDDLKRAFMVRVMLSVMQFRINARYVAADPPFIGIELDHSDSGREGCAVSTLTITSEPKDWRGAVQVAIQEVRRLQRITLSLLNPDATPEPSPATTPDATPARVGRPHAAAATAHGR